MVSDKWFIKKEDGVFGPVSADELQSLIKKGRITLNQEASQNEKGPWEPLKSYDLFHEIPRPIEEMFKAEDKSSIGDNLGLKFIRKIHKYRFEINIPGKSGSKGKEVSFVRPLDIEVQEILYGREYSFEAWCDSPDDGKAYLIGNGKTEAEAVAECRKKIEENNKLMRELYGYFPGWKKYARRFVKKLDSI